MTSILPTRSYVSTIPGIVPHYGNFREQVTSSSEDIHHSNVSESRSIELSESERAGGRAGGRSARQGLPGEFHTTTVQFRSDKGKRETRRPSILLIIIIIIIIISFFEGWTDWVFAQSKIPISRPDQTRPDSWLRYPRYDRGPSYGECGRVWHHVCPCCTMGVRKA